MERRKGGKIGRERDVGVKEGDEDSMGESDKWGSKWVRERGRLKKRERKREREKEKGGVREREKDVESMRIGKERKSPGKTDVPKLYAHNECEHSVTNKKI